MSGCKEDESCIYVSFLFGHFIFPDLLFSSVISFFCQPCLVAFFCVFLFSIALGRLFFQSFYFSSLFILFRQPGHYSFNLLTNFIFPSRLSDFIFFFNLFVPPRGLEKDNTLIYALFFDYVIFPIL